MGSGVCPVSARILVVKCCLLAGTQWRQYRSTPVRSCDLAPTPFKYVAVAALLLWPTEGALGVVQLLRGLK